jgi:hypothetical protein
MSEPRPSDGPPKKSDQAEIAARVQQVLTLRLDGAEIWDIVQYASENAWGVGERQVRNYMARAMELIAKSLEQDRPKLLGEHIARRRNLYARAVTTGELRTALSCLQDEADLLGLYPAAKQTVEHTGEGGGPVRITSVEAVLPPSPGEGGTATREEPNG